MSAIDAARRINEQLYLSGKLTFQEYAKNLYSYQQIERQSYTSSSAYVGIYRPYSARSNVISELEYFEYTGQKLGEDYRSTKLEALSALGLKDHPLKLTKKEEEEMVGSYLTARYTSSFGEAALRVPADKALKDYYLLGEKGLLRSEFERYNLGISEKTLEEYISLKSRLPLSEFSTYDFPRFAYEKTIGSKSEVEKFGLGLFTQQTLGLYEFGKMLIPQIKNEYMDLLTIAHSHKQLLNKEISSFIPLKKDEFAYNIGVISGLSLDVVSMGGMVKSALKSTKVILQPFKPITFKPIILPNTLKTVRIVKQELSKDVAKGYFLDIEGFINKYERSVKRLEKSYIDQPSFYKPVIKSIKEDYFRGGYDIIYNKRLSNGFDLKDGVKVVDKYKPSKPFKFRFEEEERFTAKTIRKEPKEEYREIKTESGMVLLQKAKTELKPETKLTTQTRQIQPIKLRHLPDQKQAIKQLNSHKSIPLTKSNLKELSLLKSSVILKQSTKQAINLRNISLTYQPRASLYKYRQIFLQKTPTPAKPTYKIPTPTKPIQKTSTPAKPTYKIPTPTKLNIPIPTQPVYKTPTSRFDIPTFAKPLYKMPTPTKLTTTIPIPTPLFKRKEYMIFKQKFDISRLSKKEYIKSKSQVEILTYGLPKDYINIVKNLRTVSQIRRL